MPPPPSASPALTAWAKPTDANASGKRARHSSVHPDRLWWARREDAPVLDLADPETAMDDRTARAALQRHWDASDAGDFEAEHEIYREDAVLDYPQSGERLRGRRNIQQSRLAQPNAKRF